MLTMNGDAVQKRILVNGTWFICNLSHKDNVQYWSVACNGAESVAEELKRNGMVVMNIREGVPTSVIEVDTLRYHVWNMDFHLNQCEDIFEWFRTSEECDFTRYYKHVVFHHPNGRFYAAYADDIDNFIEI